MKATLTNSIFQEQCILDYIPNFPSLAHLLEKLEVLSRTGENYESTVNSNMGAKYPVCMTVNKMKMTLREGEIGSVFIIVMKNLSEQAELKNILSIQEEQLAEFQKLSRFDKMMADKELRKRFKEFTIKERSSENFSFLEDVERYKSLSKTKDRSTLQQEIIQKYMLPNSPQPLNVSQKVLETEYKKISSGYGQLDLFDRLEMVIKGMILDDTFLRFTLERENEEYSESSESTSEHTVN